VKRPADPHRWARIADLFDRALSVREDDRAAWLIAVCGDDGELYDEVTTLLRVHERAGHWLSGPAAHWSHRVATGGGASGNLSPPGGTRSQPARLPSSPIGPYRVLDILGEGGMGVVYRAEDSRLGRLVALKAVAPAPDGNRADRMARLRREARAAAAITHPNIATVYSLEEADGQIYMASELVEDGTLRDELERGPLPLVRAIEATLAVARAVAAAHAGGIVHRDIKPENVACSPDGTFKVLDFGLAAAVAGGSVALTDDFALVGTPAYMSPEQIRQQKVDGRSDQFAIGVLLYELATGRHPFTARMPAATLARILDAQAEPMTDQLPDSARLADPAVLAAVQTVVDRCLRKAPADRFPDTNTLVAALEHVRTLMAPASDRGTRAGKRPQFWWQFHQAAVTAGYVLLLLPLWSLRTALGSTLGALVSLAAVVGVVVAGALRLHLWFAMRAYPDQWADQHTRARMFIVIADMLFAAALLTTGVAGSAGDLPGGALLVAAAAAIAVVSLFVEPATTRAARGDELAGRP
jgi:hypothetical protein